MSGAEAIPSLAPDPAADMCIARTVAQALAQEQDAFNWRMHKDRKLFALHLAMGWMTFLMVPTTAVALFVCPVAATGLLPLSGLSVWNWRRMLRRETSDVEPTTLPPAGVQ